MIFSDNVPLEHEVLLKDRAAARGLLVMGPDCGTALVSGAGLGFSNTVRPGPIGIVAASGTGAQQLMCLFDESGTGVSAVLGVGGRDLSAAVGGRAARAALALLDADPGTELIVLVSKPPAPDVADAVQRFAAELATPVEFALIGGDRPDLTAAAERVLTRLGTAVPHWRAWRRERPPVRPGHLRGLFGGGTLCDEAMVIAVEQVGPVGSNIPLRPQWRVDPHHRAHGHVMIDFGDDELTAGRPHPMIDPTLRTERLAAELDDPDTAVVLLDVVLGHAAHPDPAADLAPVIASAPADAAVVVTLVGADGDPQRPQTQAAALHAAGADVFTSNAVATRHALALLAGRPT
jgi:FdrA protein